MYEFDVDYLNEEYMEYYKNVLITRKIVRNIVFVLIFVAIAVVYWVDKSDATKGNFVPIASLVAAVILPCSNLLYIPLLKRQLKLREQEVKSIHIHLTFEDDKIIYENKTEALPKVEEEKPELVEENPSSAEEIVEEDSEFEKEEEPVAQKEFTLHYNNFYEVTATKNLVMMALDRQTVIIIPKRTIQKGTIENFIAFLSTKITPSRFKIKGYKNKTNLNQEEDKTEEEK